MRYTPYNEIPMKGRRMIIDKPANNKAGVDEAIAALLEEMSGYTGDSPEYARMVDQLMKLYSLQEIDAKSSSWKRVNADTLAIVGGNLLGIAMIVGHERASVVTSKAIGLLTKLR